MADDLPVTELLRRVQEGDSEALEILTEHFFQIAREIATQKLAKYPNAVKVQAGGSIIGLEGLMSAFRGIAKMGRQVASRNEFFAIFRIIVRNKIADVARDEFKEAPPNLGEHEPPGRELTPVDEVIQKETEERLRRLAARAFELIDEIDEEIEWKVAYLGVICLYSANQIREALRPDFPDREPPSKAAILVWLRRIRKRLARELGAEGFDE